jgi:cell division protein FtsB
VKDWSLRVRLAAFATLVVLVLFTLVYPARAYLAQRNAVGHAHHDLSALDTQNRKLQRDASRLMTPSEIERLARARFNMVRPGEEAYSVVPAPAPTVAPRTTTTTAPPPTTTTLPPTTTTTVAKTTTTGATPTTTGTTGTTKPRSTTTTTRPRSTTTAGHTP